MRSYASLAVDVFSLTDAVIGACIFASVWGDLVLHYRGLVLALLVIPLWTMLFRYFGIYDSHRTKQPGELLSTVLAAHLVGLAFIAMFAWNLHLPRGFMHSLEFVSYSAAIVITERCALYWVLRGLRGRGHNVHQVCVVGEWNNAKELAERLGLHPEWGMRIICVGCLDDGVGAFTRYPAGDALKSATLEDVFKEEIIDEVVIAVPPEDLPRQGATVRLCEQYGLVARVLLDIGRASIHSPELERFHDKVLISSGAQPRNEYAIVLKRLLDLTLALITIVLCAPLLMIIAMLVKLSSPGPVIFRQRRVGLHGRHFTLYKFRTMIQGAESMITTIAYRNITKGPTFKDPADPRITNIGRVLRRFSLDELPQLFNVLRGDMSLVGPRPLPVSQCDEIVGAHRRRFAMKPGITCLWQVNGRSDVEFSQWMKYDLQYVDEWSLILDAKLLVKTIPVVLSGKASY